jgi:hypothetical protein
VLALGVPVLVLLGLGVGYYRLVYFERVAALHLPVGARFAARVDLEQVVMFEPARRNLLPALDGATMSIEGQSLSQRIKATTGVNLAMDLREIVFALGPEHDQWLVVLSGLFPKHALSGVTAAVRADSRITVSDSSDGVQRLDPWRLFVAQASDGAFLISNHEALLRGALVPTQVFRDLGLARDGAGSVGAVFSQASQGFSHASQGFSQASPAAFSAVARLRAQLALGPTVTVRVEVDPTSATGGDASVWLAGAKLHAAGAELDGSPWNALRPGLARAEAVASSENRWVFQTFFERHEVDTLGADLAAALAHRLQLPAAALK